MIVTINDKIYHPFKSAPPPKPDNWFKKWLTIAIGLNLSLFLPSIFIDYDNQFLQTWHIILLLISLLLLLYLIFSVIFSLIKKFLKLKIVIYR